MNRTENDLRNALHEMERHATEQTAPSLDDILAGARTQPADRGRGAAARWLAPVAVAAAVAVAAGVTTIALRSTPGGSAAHTVPAAASGSRPASPRPSAKMTSPARTADQTEAVAILNDAAAQLDHAPAWTTPDPQQFFYVETNQATTWTSVSGTRPGIGHTTDGTTVAVPGCKDGQIVSVGESGTCTLNDVPHYLGDAPTTPSAWDAYLEKMAPGAKAANAQGKIIVGALHQDLTAPRPAAALLRYTAGCPGLHTLTVKPAAGKNLIGVTCTSMTNGSYGLAFDIRSHAFLGFVGVNPSGHQDWAAEITLKTAIVASAGQQP